MSSFRVPSSEAHCDMFALLLLQGVGFLAQVPTLEIFAPGSGAAAARFVRKPGQSGSTMCKMGSGTAHSLGSIKSLVSLD